MWREKTRVRSEPKRQICEDYAFHAYTSVHSSVVFGEAEKRPHPPPTTRLPPPPHLPLQ